MGIFKLFGNAKYSVSNGKWVVLFPVLQKIFKCSFSDAVAGEIQKYFLLI
jgi:hypothetical protein